ncbi:MAG: hypothetical protein IJD02_04740 [Lachnospiraceae bacterium]|nr:hypothetical protein [Lachnospiraceae bacterium]
MKDKIGKFAKGQFEYTTPRIILDKESINETAFAGTIAKGSILLSSSGGTVVKALVYSDREELKFEKESYIGIKNEIKYSINCQEAIPGEVIDGKLIIVSSLGEIELPYSFKIEKQALETEGVKLKDLYEFTEYARNNFYQASRLFAGEEFERAFLVKDARFKVLYDSLIKGEDKCVALEEFLVGAHKKHGVNLSADRKIFDYPVDKEDFRERVVLTKDTWGYVRYNLRTDHPAIRLDRNVINNDDFIGNTFTLDFVVDSSFVPQGRHKAHIYIENVSGVIKLEINLTKQGKKNQDLSTGRMKAFQCRFLKNYIAFRTGNIDVEKYVADSEVLISNLCILTETGINDLFKVHLMMASGRLNKASELLVNFDNALANQKQEDGLLKAGSMYLHTMLDKNPSLVTEAANTIRGYYDADKERWEYLWLLLYLDKKYESNPAARIMDIKQAYQMGCISPVMYYEACMAYNQDSTLIKELGAFEISALYWGAKNNCLSNSVMATYIMYALRLKNYYKLVFKTLVLFKDKYREQDLLCAICTQLIKGQKVGDKYFKWYREGVQAKLKITQLHEYYMYSFDENSKEPLPQSLLLYFSYNSGLSDMKKAYLYANIIKNKQGGGHSTYKNYKKLIYAFARKQMQARVINENLKVIYEDFLASEGIDEETATNLPYVMFRNDVSCYNPEFKGIVAVSKILKQEQYTPFIDGRTQINIYAQDTELFLVDKDNNRYARTNFFTVKKLLNPDNYIDKCYLKNPSSNMCLIYMADQLDNSNKLDTSSNITARKKVIEIEELRDDYKRKCLYSLIQYCYDNREVELLDAYLEQIDLMNMSKRERSYIVEYLIIRGFYEKALRGVMAYGVSVIPVKQLFKLAIKCIAMEWEEELIEGIVTLCYYVFKHDMYDEALLSYLCRHFSLGTKDMLSVWKASKNMGVDTGELEERLLGQILFAESYSMDSAAVFESYYGHSSDKVLVRAFLKYNAYKYVVKDRVVQESIFEILKKEIASDKNELCILALLKYYSTLSELDKSETIFVDYYVNHFGSKGIVLPFFKNFGGKINLPEYICDKCYIEYNADPSIQVDIHYLIDSDNGDESGFVTETMKDVYMGIRVKEFMIFYGEKLQYYISEKGLMEDKITESFNASVDATHEEDNSRYSKINLCLISREMKDEKTMLDVMKNIARTDYLAENLFNPM